jgi:exopolyphosphatase/guanosine-5'-triphosphate,3'-diphosphate pyrophosphatase
VNVKYDAIAGADEARSNPASGSGRDSRWAEPGGRPPEGPERRSRSRSYAALDLGTNNCRLLIAEPAHFGFRVVDAFSRIVRLGEGLGHGNQLGADAIERTIDALRVCRDKMEAKDVARARLVATEACRLAANGPAFVDRVREELGLTLEIVDRKTEAYLAVTGCASLVDPDADSVVVFDIGGGSTEIAWLDGPATNMLVDPCGRIRAWDSLPVGVVTLAERHGGVKVTRESFRGMVEEVTERLFSFNLAASASGEGANFHLLGTSGTVTTIGGIHLKLPRYDRRRVDGMWMRNAEITGVLERLLNSDYHERAANPCIGRERADLVLAGCAILEAIRLAFPSDRLRIADRGLREGILMNMMRDDGVWRQEAYR